MSSFQLPASSASVSLLLLDAFIYQQLVIDRDFPSDCLRRWIAVRLDWATAFVACAASLMCALGREWLPPGMAGLVITYSLAMAGIFQYSVCSPPPLLITSGGLVVTSLLRLACTRTHARTYLPRPDRCACCQSARGTSPQSSAWSTTPPRSRSSPSPSQSQSRARSPTVRAAPPPRQAPRGPTARWTPAGQSGGTRRWWRPAGRREGGWSSRMCGCGTGRTCRRCCGG
jgi:hypothetical protein